MKTHESEQTYLETILILSKNGGLVRSINVANTLGYSRPSISIAMKNLREKELVTVDEGGYITLTKAGRGIAESMYERHTLISDWLIFLGVDKNTADNDACKIEHFMSEQSFLAIKKHIEEWKAGCHRAKSMT
jgi:Mn-dependent DtxR family transcriptional regulator